MGYGSYNNGYQGYQRGAAAIPTNPYRARRGDYQEIATRDDSRLQSMEVLSGREYGLEYENNNGEGGMLQHRWSLYCLIGFLLLVVMVAPHQNDNGMMWDDDGSDNTTTLVDSTSTSPQSSPTVSKNTKAPQVSESEWMVTSKPVVVDPSDMNPLADFIAQCHLPDTFRLDLDNNIYLDVTNFCLDQVSIEVYMDVEKNTVASTRHTIILLLTPL